MNRTAALILASLIGITIGIGIYTFVYAKGGSYLSNDPAACANCHIMTEHFDAWAKSSHRTVATCNDCHTPPGFIAKYATKASNGFWHSFAFTTGDFPDPLTIKTHNRVVTEQACRKCHAEIVEAIEAGPGADRAYADDEPSIDPRPTVGEEMRLGHSVASTQTSCVRCHMHVGHWVR
ncbi:MAG: cytochrome c nitrite reductase small subunit [bacterium]|nr:cytochrome c nitrite reductase small subunit [Candidatus Kapabacteria bacterium]